MKYGSEEVREKEKEREKKEAYEEGCGMKKEEKSLKRSWGEWKKRRDLEEKRKEVEKRILKKKFSLEVVKKGDGERTIRKG